MNNKNNKINTLPPEQITINEIKGKGNSDTIEAPKYSKYYLHISTGFKIAKIVVVSILCFFIFFVLFFYGETFTYENARYVLRDLGQILSEESLTPSEKITFDADGDMDFSIFRSNIVCVGESSTSILSVTGKEKLSDNKTNTAPTVVSGNKYCVVYSLGGRNLSVYNTVARVYDFNFEFPIYDVSVSDNGDIAVMTRSREYRCVVHLYDPDFNLVATYNKASYPSCVSLSNNGNSLFICTLNSSDGTFLSEISHYKKGDAQTLYSLNVTDRLPVDMTNMSSSLTCVSFERGIIFVDSEGSIKKSYDYSSDITSCMIGKEYVTVSLDNGCAILYNSQGDPLLQHEDSKIVSASGFDGYLIIEKKDRITVVGDGITRDEMIDASPKKILYLNGYVYLCYSHSIKSINITES